MSLHALLFICSSVGLMLACGHLKRLWLDVMCPVRCLALVGRRLVMSGEDPEVLMKRPALIGTASRRF